MVLRPRILLVRGVHMCQVYTFVHHKTKPPRYNTGTASACDPIESFGTGIMSSTDPQVDGCGQNQVLLAGESCAVQCDTSDGYDSGYGLFTCDGNTIATTALRCSRTCSLENVQDKFGATEEIVCRKRAHRE